MRTIEEIRAALIASTETSEREALLSELDAASSEKPTQLQELRSQLAETAEKRTQLLSEFEQLTRGAVDEHGDAREFTPEEAERRGELKARIAAAQERHQLLEDQARQAEVDERDARMEQRLAEFRRSLGFSDGLHIGSDGLAGVSVTETPVYTRRGGASFVKDIAYVSFGPGQVGSAWSRASERLARHAQQNHHRALELEDKAGRLDEVKREQFAASAEGYFVRQMVEAAQGREDNAGAHARTGQFVSYRALSTGSGAGGEFVPPMYLTEDWIAFLRAGRVAANSCRHFALPDGTMSINIPKVLSGTSAAPQGTQNTNVSDTDITTAFVTVPVVTVAGAQVISLQLLERSPVHFDEVIWGDLASAQAQQMDVQILNGSGSAGQMTGILNTTGINTVTWTQTAPTVKGLMGQVGLAKAAIANAIFRPATHGFMVPNVWEWIGQSVDTANRPLVVPQYQGPFNAVAVAADNATAEGSIGRHFSGLDTYEDANVPQTLGANTNQSVVLVARMQENFLYESPVVTRALPQTLGLQMSVVLQLYGYAAFSAARYPTANSVVTGTGLASSSLTYNS
jgi:HK97 family phage major capsid protein